ncbi:MAG: putative metal-binding motif-containing protein [Patescibacteria group bacterium]|nr:hypothetical protein [Patescibacteria group bacterium]
MKIKIFLFGLAFVLLLAPGVVFAADGAGCPAVTGHTNQASWPDDGVKASLDEGPINFDATRGEYFRYAACSENIGTLIATDYRIKGWAWNENLGWISFFCGDEGKLENGSPVNTNLGVKCVNDSLPDLEYGVRIMPNGTLAGWAWNDNAGWISFGCNAGVNEGSACGGINYSMKLDATYDETKDPKEITGNKWSAGKTHAWNDSVGYIDFSTTTIPWAPNKDFACPSCVDIDGDTYKAGASQLCGKSCAVMSGGDCDDNNANRNPGMKELCDGIDNDCDSEIDEGYKLGAWCAVGVGECMTTGTKVCHSSKIATTCTAKPPVLSGEVCDGLDNDCDGGVDEGLVCICSPGDTQACGSSVGECKSGTQTCEADKTWGECTGQVGPQAEYCDGKDNNCNGLTDEGNVCECEPGASQPCGTDTGECVSGARICGEDGKWPAVCVGEVTPVPEVCGDGLDNNCNGEVDEGCVVIDVCNPPGTTGFCCTSGKCEAGVCDYGTRTCEPSGVWSECMGEMLPGAEVCGDGLDNDCDGLTDEEGCNGGCTPNYSCADETCVGSTCFTGCPGDFVDGTKSCPPFICDPNCGNATCEGYDDGCDAGGFCAGALLCCVDPPCPPPCVPGSVPGSVDISGQIKIRGAISSQNINLIQYQSVGDSLKAFKNARTQMRKNIVNLLKGRTPIVGTVITEANFASDDIVYISNQGGYSLSTYPVTLGLDLATVVGDENERKVVIIEGADLHIRGDIYGDLSTAGKLGIVVLKNLYNNRGGNIYISSNVQKIQANIYAEGVIFPHDYSNKGYGAIYKSNGSYQKAVSQIEGEPDGYYEESGNALYDFFRWNKQLYIQGSIMSRNLLGTADEVMAGKYTLPNDNETKTGHFLQSRMYDLAYMRWNPCKYKAGWNACYPAAGVNVCGGGYFHKVVPDTQPIVIDFVPPQGIPGFDGFSSASSNYSN